MALYGILALTASVWSVSADVELKDDPAAYMDTLRDMFSPPPKFDDNHFDLPDAFIYDDDVSAGGSRRLGAGKACKVPKPFPSYYTPDPAFTVFPKVPVFNWTSVDGWHKCGGNFQSPIEIVATDYTGTSPYKGKKSPVTFEFKGDTLTDLYIGNNQHNVGASFTTGSKLSFTKGKVKSEDYYLAQFHFHSPSEHRLVVGGVNVYTPLEMHMVHINAEGDKKKYAVISIMFEVDDEQAGSNGGYKFLQLIEETVGQMYNGHKKVKVGNVDLTNLGINDSSYYYYEGSLTTPPCTEKVQWFILSEPRYITSDMHKAFANGIGVPGGNNRPLNPLNGRVVSFQAKTHKGGNSNGEDESMM